MTLLRSLGNLAGSTGMMLTMNAAIGAVGGFIVALQEKDRADSSSLLSKLFAFTAFPLEGAVFGALNVAKYKAISSGVKLFAGEHSKDITFFANLLVDACMFSSEPVSGITMVLSDFGNFATEHLFDSTLQALEPQLEMEVF
jgi:hypothetical protein